MAKIEIYIGSRDRVGLDCNARRRARCAFLGWLRNESGSGRAPVLAEHLRLSAAHFLLGLRDCRKYLSHEHRRPPGAPNADNNLAFPFAKALRQQSI
jgi:hypothetical protein